jgi:hypothetical protein
MYFLFNRLTTLLLVALFSCNAPDPQDASETKPTEEQANTAEASVLIVTASERYESLKIRTTDAQLENVYLQDTVQLRDREGILCQNEAKDPATHYGFQANPDLSRYYIAMYQGSMMTETFEWCRLYEYDPEKESWKQLINFGEIYRPIWKYVAETNVIIYVDQVSSTLLSYKLENGRTDTLQEVAVDIRQHAWSETEGAIQLTFATGGQLQQLSYDLGSEQTSVKTTAPISEFSSIYEDYVLQIYFTDPGNQGFRLYENQDMIADQPFTVGNVNSFWNEDGQFYLLGEKNIFLLNPQLDTLGQIALNRPFIFNVLDEYVMAHERQEAAGGELQFYKLKKDLSAKETLSIMEDPQWTVLVRGI